MKKYLNKEFLLSNKQHIIKAAAIMILIAVCFFVFILGGNQDDSGTVVQAVQETSAEGEGGEEAETKSKILVDVGGAVKMPQVVELETDSRVADAISAAGGLKDSADTTEINQAAFLTDGEKIYIPEIGETNPSGWNPGDQNSFSSSLSKININTATSEELQTLNGVGPATAEKILAYRSSNGSFKCIEDLKKVDGIGDKTFDKLKEQIKV